FFAAWENTGDAESGYSNDFPLSDSDDARSKRRRCLRPVVPTLPAARAVPRYGRRRPPVLLVQAGAAVRRSDGAARHRGTRARHARGQRKRTTVHRRLRRHLALRNAVCVWLRVLAAIGL